MILKSCENQTNTLSFYPNGSYKAHYGSMTFTSAFQPIFDSRNRKVGVEALLRAFNDSGEPIPPNEIFHNSAVPESDLVNINNLCRILHIHNFSLMRHKRKKELRLFINLTPLACEDVAVGLMDDLFDKKHLKVLNLKPDNICIEFVESQYDSNYILGIASQSLKGKGFNVAYDDFTNNVNDYLRLEQIKPEIVKMDMTLVRQYMEGNSIPLMQAFESAKLSGAKTLAEGIEDLKTLKEMKRIGFDYFQGFFLGMPELLNLTTKYR